MDLEKFFGQWGYGRVEYVFVGTRTWMSSSQDEEFKEGPLWCWAELECEANVEGFGTANLSRLVSSPTVKSVSVKCRLQTYCLDSFLTCCAFQGMPRLSAHSWALCKNGTRKYKNETLIPMISVLCYIFTARWMPYVTQTIHCMLCWLQHIGQILIYYESNIRHLIKHWRWTNSSSSYDTT